MERIPEHTIIERVIHNTDSNKIQDRIDPLQAEGYEVVNYQYIPIAKLTFPISIITLTKYKSSNLKGLL